MDWTGWATFGFGATVALTAVLVTAQLSGLTRMDIPMLLGRSSSKISTRHASLVSSTW